jgi:tRNA A37 threonylcarbamoyladenosine synthetase subunit TsaC/SUA5/YrdC
VLKEGGLVIYPTDTVMVWVVTLPIPKLLERIAKIKGIKLEKLIFPLFV